MSNLIHRLRNARVFAALYGEPEPICEEAANAIEVANARIAELEASLQASRRAALEECWGAVHGERLEDPTETHGDMVYERAIEDCENAIRALAGATET
jgi:hypothetical protein